MLHIRKRPRFDNLVNQQRATTVAWGRRIYVALIAILALTLLNHFAGDAVVLRADGILLTDRYVVAATYSARVAAVHVKEGDTVQQGTVLVELESSEMLKDLADLVLRTANLTTRLTQLRIRTETVASLIPLAERHARETNDAVARADNLSKRNLISSQSLNQTLTAEYDTAARLAELRGQASSLDEELTLTERSHAKAGAALTQLEMLYDRGQLRAAAAGVVGPRVPVVGQVVKFGEELLQIYGGRPYVLAYLPDKYWFAVSRGDRVEVTGGTGSASETGTVDSILGVADALPAEFQNMFRPRDRSRLIRIDLPKDHGFAISQKVRVGGCLPGWCWKSPLSN
jgi:multidrug resistance efflux pump